MAAARAFPLRKRDGSARCTGYAASALDQQIQRSIGRAGQSGDLLPDVIQSRSVGDELFIFKRYGVGRYLWLNLRRV